jgi:hypothetical protein
LKEEALDRFLWRTLFGRGYGPVVRQTAEWMNEWMMLTQELKHVWLQWRYGVQRGCLLFRQPRVTQRHTGCTAWSPFNGVNACHREELWSHPEGMMWNLWCMKWNGTGMSLSTSVSAFQCLSTKAAHTCSHIHHRLHVVWLLNSSLKKLFNLPVL